MDVKERLKLFIKYLGLTNQQFEINVGVSNGYIANMREGVGKTGLERISQKYPELNIGWLLTGEGEMLKSESSSTGNQHFATKSDKISALNKMIADIQLNGKKRDKIRFIPLMDIDAVGGSGNDIYDSPEYIEELMPVTGASESSICLSVSGDSMMPVFNPGDLVVIDEIIEWTLFLEMGQYYVITLKDNRRLIKKITYSEEDKTQKFLLLSENPKYPPVELPKSLIHRIFMVTQKHQKLTL